ncbi:MAG: hypothetical protein KAR39_04295 [Thermoplasmata archaeon]|nr:hypothetical protein [Thermoplasmata archaeon]
MEHLLPQSLKGLRDEKNVVWVCQKCNSAKGARRPREWYTITQGLCGAKYGVPRIAEGKYLKLVYRIVREKGLLNLSVQDLKAQVCPKCDFGTMCVNEESMGNPSPPCLDGVVTFCLRELVTEDQ